jgi:hypothetical protein
VADVQRGSACSRLQRVEKHDKLVVIHSRSWRAAAFARVGREKAAALRQHKALVNSPTSPSQNREGHSPSHAQIDASSTA